VGHAASAARCVFFSVAAFKHNTQPVRLARYSGSLAGAIGATLTRGLGLAGSLDILTSTASQNKLHKVMYQ